MGTAESTAQRQLRPSGSYTPPSEPRSVSVADAVPWLSPGDLMRAPGTLYLAGDQSLLRTFRRVAIVGARMASPEGRRRAEKLARQLAEAGIVVVSGLALGIDTAAHVGAMNAGGHTIAVIGTPLDRAYPPENSALQERIYTTELLVSQFGPDSPTHGKSFVARNRTMALISEATVIVEASDTSGSLSQATECLKLGRSLFLMRSVLDRPGISWPKRFIDQGASVLERVEQLTAQR